MNDNYVISMNVQYYFTKPGKKTNTSIQCTCLFNKLTMLNMVFESSHTCPTNVSCDAQLACHGRVSCQVNLGKPQFASDYLIQ